MIISRAEIASAISAYKTVKRKSSASAPSADSFERSEEAAALGGMLVGALSQPFYRPDLVDELREQIAQGRYFVPTDQIVEKLLGRLIVEYATA